MRRKKLIVGLALVVLVAAGVTGFFVMRNRTPEKYYERGMTALTDGDYKSASVFFRTAIKRNPRFGEAYWKLGEAELRAENIRNGIGALRRAVELMPGRPEPANMLAETLLTIYSVQRQKDPEILKDVDGLAKDLLKKDPKSYEGLRLEGLLSMLQNDMPMAAEKLNLAIQINPNRPEAPFALTQALAAMRKLPEAETVAKDLIERNPTYLEAYRFLIRLYAAQKRIPEIEAILAKRTEKNPKNSQARLEQAAFYLSNNQKERSEQILNDIVARPADFPNGRMEVGDFYFRLQIFDRAEKLYQEGAAQDQKRADEYRLRVVQVKLAQNKADEALNQLNSILQTSPKYYTAQHVRGELNLRLAEAKGNDKTQLQAAIKDFEALVAAKAPSTKTDDVLMMSKVRASLGRAYELTGDLAKAAMQYEDAIKAAPGLTGPRMSLAQVYLRQRAIGKAIQLCDEVIKREPRTILAYTTKAAALIQSQDYAQARRSIEEALKLNPTNPMIMAELASLNLREGKVNEAEATLRQLYQKHPEDPRFAIGLAEAVAAKGNRQEAFKIMEAAAAKNDKMPEVRRAASIAALRNNQVDIAAGHIQKLLERDPNSVQDHLRLGEILRFKRAFPESLASFQKAHSLAPDNPVANLQLALALDAVGRQADSTPYYEAVLKTDSGNSIALNNLAYRLADKGQDLDRALRYAEQAVKNAPNTPVFEDTLGWVYLKKNLPDSAIPIFRRLLEKQPNNPEWLFHLGLAQYQKGDKTGARQTLRNALANKPSEADVARINEILKAIG
jgi:tetratricopeptide (TPR) repeat protein